MAPFRPSNASILNLVGGKAVEAFLPSLSICQKPSVESASWGNFNEKPTTAIGSSLICMLKMLKMNKAARGGRATAWLKESNQNQRPNGTELQIYPRLAAGS